MSPDRLQMSEIVSRRQGRPQEGGEGKGHPEAALSFSTLPVGKRSPVCAVSRADALATGIRGSERKSASGRGEYQVAAPAQIRARVFFEIASSGRSGHDCAMFSSDPYPRHRPVSSAEARAADQEASA